MEDVFLGQSVQDGVMLAAPYPACSQLRATMSRAVDLVNWDTDRHAIIV